MTVPKVWDGSTWMAIQGIPGPQGPKGDTGPAGPMGAPPVVTSLPASPTDGQEVYFQTGSLLWHLRYSSAQATADTYGWQFVGGDSINAVVATSEAIASTSYVDAATPGPSVTVPLAGIYRINGSSVLHLPATNGAAGFMAAKLGTAATADTEAMAYLANNAAVILRGMSGSAPIERTLAASTVVKAQYKATTGTISFEHRRMEVLPVRVK